MQWKPSLNRGKGSLSLNRTSKYAATQPILGTSTKAYHLPWAKRCMKRLATSKCPVVWTVAEQQQWSRAREASDSWPPKSSSPAQLTWQCPRLFLSPVLSYRMTTPKRIERCSACQMSPRKMSDSKILLLHLLRSHPGVLPQPWWGLKNQ